MSRLLRGLPILDAPVLVRGKSIPVKDAQIIVWVSLNLEEVKSWDPNVPRIPALLDTGHNDNFFISESQLRQWAGIHPASLGLLPASRLTHRSITRRRASLCLHLNVPGQRDVFTDKQPFVFAIEDGIAICEDNRPKAPRLPLLGLRALLANKLILNIDGTRNQINLRTAAPWWWPF